MGGIWIETRLVEERIERERMKIRDVLESGRVGV